MLISTRGQFRWKRVDFSNQRSPHFSEFRFRFGLRECEKTTNISTESDIYLQLKEEAIEASQSIYYHTVVLKVNVRGVHKSLSCIVDNSLSRCRGQHHGVTVWMAKKKQSSSFGLVDMEFFAATVISKRRYFTGSYLRSRHWPFL